jgi:hypothetical protein
MADSGVRRRRGGAGGARSGAANLMTFSSEEGVGLKVYVYYFFLFLFFERFFVALSFLCCCVSAVSYMDDGEVLIVLCVAFAYLI